MNGGDPSNASISAINSTGWDADLIVPSTRKIKVDTLENTTANAGIKFNSPHGEIGEYYYDSYGNNPGANWVLCDGSAISRAVYSVLFGKWGTKYGAGDGATTFNVPDWRGKFPVGYSSADADYNDWAKTGGEKAHALTSGENGPHTHNVTRQAVAGGAIATIDHVPNAQSTATTATSSSGSGTAHENRPPFTVFYKVYVRAL
jgi:microcystin-dependent protein